MVSIKNYIFWNCEIMGFRFMYWAIGFLPTPNAEVAENFEEIKDTLDELIYMRLDYLNGRQ